MTERYYCFVSSMEFVIRSLESVQFVGKLPTLGWVRAQFLPDKVSWFRVGWVWLAPGWQTLGEAPGKFIYLFLNLFSKYSNVQYLNCRGQVLSLKRENKWASGVVGGEGSTPPDYVNTTGIYISGRKFRDRYLIQYLSY